MLYVALNQTGLGRSARNMFHLMPHPDELADDTNSLFLCGSDDAGVASSGSGKKIGSPEWFERARSYWRGGVTQFLASDGQVGSLRALPEGGPRVSEARRQAEEGARLKRPMSDAARAARQLRGKQISHVWLNAFADRNGGTAYMPVIRFTNGRFLRFVVQETETGEYGVQPVYPAKPQGDGMRDRKPRT